jgi:hypothetical protein
LQRSVGIIRVFAIENFTSVGDCNLDDAVMRSVFLFSKWEYIAEYLLQDVHMQTKKNIGRVKITPAPSMIRRLFAQEW